MINEIIFYNNNHIGDTYFSQQIIENFCLLNSNNYIIKFYCSYNWYIYKDIPNLILLNTNNKYEKDILNNEIPPELNIIDEELKKNIDFFGSISHNKYIIKDNILFINTWVLMLGFDAECNFLKMHFNFANLINELNYKLDLRLVYRITNKLIKLPYINNDKFLEYKKINNYKYIFYYNYYGRSGQHLPIDSIYDHDDIIINLANKNKDKIIIIPKINDNIKNNCKNVLDPIKLFDCHQTPSCDNIIKLINIASLCDIVISFDIGACFYLINEEFPNIFKGKWMHLGLNDKCYNIICDNFKNSGNLEIINNISYYNVNNKKDIENILTTNII